MFKMAEALFQSDLNILFLFASHPLSNASLALSAKKKTVISEMSIFVTPGGVFDCQAFSESTRKTLALLSPLVDLEHR